MDRISDLETNGDAKAFPVNECLECKLVSFSNPNTWSRFQKKEGRKRKNNKALAYAALSYPLQLLCRTAASRGTEECECEQKGVGLTALTSDNAEDTNVIIYW